MQPPEEVHRQPQDTRTAEGVARLVDHLFRHEAEDVAQEALLQTWSDYGIPPMHAGENHAALAKFHPIARMGEISDMVDAVLYLENATFVTGEKIHVDGGVHAGR
jgi:NAD(P)-dependent dehydrogenase (short-subunit alcohol dehydrogenase family)